MMNERVLAADPDNASRAQAFYNIGALQFEEYKRSSELGLLEAAIDRFIQSLQNSGQEHPMRKLLIIGLQGMLVDLTLKTPDPIITGERWHKTIISVPFRSLEQKALQAAWRAPFGERAQIDNPPSQSPSFLETNRARLRAHVGAMRRRSFVSSPPGRQNRSRSIATRRCGRRSRSCAQNFRAHCSSSEGKPTTTTGAYRLRWHARRRKMARRRTCYGLRPWPRTSAMVSHSRRIDIAYHTRWDE
jgi:hypothetical protein